MIRRSKNLMNNSKKSRDEMRYMFHRTDEFETFEQKNYIVLPVELSPNKPVLAMNYNIQRKIQEEPIIERQPTEDTNDEPEEKESINQLTEENKQNEPQKNEKQQKEEEIITYNEKEEINNENAEIEIEEEEENDVYEIPEVVHSVYNETEVQNYLDEKENQFHFNKESKDDSSHDIQSEEEEEENEQTHEDNGKGENEFEIEVELEAEVVSDIEPESQQHSPNKSSIKNNVERQGGNVNGVLRFSIQWNDTGEWDRNDLDAHCIEPNGNEIMYNNRRSPFTSGVLDIDIKEPVENQAACENIVWTNLNRMKSGKYVFFVRNYEYRNGHGGFRAEIQAGDQTYDYDYRSTLKNGEDVYVAEVTLKRKQFSINHLLNCV